MVYINYDCINIDVPDGILGGAICMCSNCIEKRNKLINKIEYIECNCKIGRTYPNTIPIPVNFKYIPYKNTTSAYNINI